MFIVFLEQNQYIFQFKNFHITFLSILAFKTLNSSEFAGEKELRETLLFTVKTNRNILFFCQNRQKWKKVLRVANENHIPL